MKMKWKVLSLTISALALVVLGTTAYANKNRDTEDKISNNVFIEDMNISGMTEEEARSAVESYLEEINTKTLTFKINEHEVLVEASELGLTWANEDVIQDAVNLGSGGNIIQRYKAVKDLEREPHVFELEIEADRNLVESIISEKCLEFDIEAVDSGLKRENESFTIVEGNDGLEVAVDDSIENVVSFIADTWDREDASVDLIVEVTKPKGTPEELSKVKDLLSSFTTSYSSSGSSRSGNVENGTRLINGFVLYPGDIFSAYEAISPFTTGNGYYLAGSYLNGMVVDSLGGGICQVSTTLYNAVLRAELEIVERSPHSMVVGYVDLAADAAIAGTYKDLKFKNNTDSPIYIEGITQGKKLTFNIYGQETRPSNRTIEFKSETLSSTSPGPDSVTWDGGLAAGVTKVTQEAHAGYVAKLYKYVYENGVQVSVEEVNKSSYKASPKFISIGTATANPEYAARIAEAMATGDYALIHAAVNAVAAEEAAQTSAEPQPEQPAPQPEQPTPQPEQPAPEPEQSTPEQPAPEQQPVPESQPQSETQPQTETPEVQ